MTLPENHDEPPKVNPTLQILSDESWMSRRHRGGRPTRGGPSTRGSNRPSARSSRPPPGGVCRFFWGTGRCRLGFECQYKHIASDPGLPSNVQPTNGASSMPALLEGGYSKIGNLGSDAFQSPPSVVMQSNEAHNALKRFLRDGYRFSSTSDVYAFLAPLESASGWGNGLSRITDVLLWSDVEFNAGTDRTTLSFQRGYFPVIRFLASGFIVKSTMTKCANTLYQTFLDNFDFIKLHLEAAIDDMVNSCSFKDPNAEQERALSGAELFSCLATVLFECMSRFKTAIIDCRVLVEIIDKLRLWSSDWIQGMTSVPPVFQDILCDNPDAKRVVVSHIEKQINRLLAIAEREMAKVDRVHEKHVPSALLGSRQRGTRRVKKGPRHDNDFADIDDIRIAPTHEELACKIPPYLPINVYDAPHHHPQESMERLQDTQFRLLREELTAPLRTSIQCVLDDLHNTKTKTTLSDLRKRNGGRYKGLTENGQDSVLFNLYTNVKFEEVVPDRRGLSVKISFDTPPGRARSQRPNARAQFWESSSGKRLMQGGLIGLVWRERGQITVHLGIIASPAKEIAEFVRNNPDRVAIRVAFFDSSLDVRALDALKFGGKKSTGDMLLVESPVMFEAVRPFLEALRVEPESIPFKEYLVHRPRSFLGKCEVPPPKYARMPGFHYQLAPLFPESSGVTDLKLFPTKQDSISEARTALDNSRLDPSQATAVVDALTREISLIQGPPGTGKSFVGIELLRVLVKTATPILMIAFTNHALDHLLSGVLDAGITSNIVRLGSRSADERVSSYSIEQLEHSNDRSSLLGSITSRNFRNLKDVERQFEQLLAKIKRPYTSSQDVTNFLLDKFPEHGKSIRDPPAWIRELHRQLQIAYQDRWTEVNRNQGRNDPRDDSLYSFWSRHEDIAFLSTPTYEELDPPRESHSEVQSTNMFDLLEQVGSFDDEDDEVCPVGDLPEWQKSFFASGAEVESTSNPSMNSDQADRSGDQGLARSPDPPVEPPRRSNLDVFFEAFDQPVPSIPSLDRPLENLLEDWNLWRMSRTERATLDGYWKQEIRRSKEQLYASEFDRLKQDHDTVLRAYNEGKEEVRRQLLEGVDIVGCTTTVLGAAKLTSLLRGVGPRIMLVEEAGQVLEAHILGSLVPSIEHMILIGDPLQLRPTLNNYFRHVAHGAIIILGIPHVSNRRAEKDAADHLEPHKVKMIRDLVLYLLKQGCYSKEGDIVVLCAYLGQLAKVRDALQDVVAVVIDERDQDELASREDGNENDDPTPSVEQFRVSKRVRLRTVDNYQGEEAKIVILSLVRNATSRWDAENQNRSTIGFLKWLSLAPKRVCLFLAIAHYWPQKVVVVFNRAATLLAADTNVP
ncbi:hypothetical protein CC1G_02000 [Coprinopsis cinerea okayama7|uniref:C3H1-type domain-containing protein n=1 Tax=Coprinopsis cinerea (strain Okayama-7 / 130 / ATCC MYA-4618 / FGSC 9003) TaxID=240176 RepID=A8N691_COPC7|nr:hypothetical protein CC1G_02000 [Coprinopsis cinerea okayama7\|eukprot:XP_001830364.2 hypothetical protein CC1G_02000 [Coprinopsis cinerea okayama7\